MKNTKPNMPPTHVSRMKAGSKERDTNQGVMDHVCEHGPDGLSRVVPMGPTANEQASIPTKGNYK